MTRSIIVLLFVTLAGCHTPPPAANNSAAKPTTEKSIGLLPEVSQFLNEHKEFGEPVKTEPIPDWAKGKRQRVEFVLNGTRRNLLFYTKENKVVTVYEDTSDGRKVVWGETEKL